MQKDAHDEGRAHPRWTAFTSLPGPSGRGCLYASCPISGQLHPSGGITGIHRPAVVATRPLVTGKGRHGAAKIGPRADWVKAQNCVLSPQGASTVERYLTR